jgi:hypothetical protein
MRPSSWFEIECVDGAAATLYFRSELPIAELDEVRRDIGALPHSVRILRVQLRGTASDGTRTGYLLHLLRRWREARVGAQVIMVHHPAQRAWPRDTLRRHPAVTR